MVFIRAGSFQMGDNLDGDTFSKPVHEVRVSAFYIDKYEVTTVLWNEVYQWATNHGYILIILAWVRPETIRFRA